MCPEWAAFEPFEKWASINGYMPGLTIDRRDNSKGYSPENCRWVSQQAQCNNKRTNHLIEHQGIVQNLSTWAIDFGINYATTLRSRIRNGWEIGEALETPIKGRRA